MSNTVLEITQKDIDRLSRIGYEVGTKGLKSTQKPTDETAIEAAEILAKYPDLFSLAALSKRTDASTRTPDSLPSKTLTKQQSQRQSYSFVPPSGLEGKRVVIAENEGIVTMHLSTLLRSHGMEVVGIAADGKEAVEIVLKTRPDIVLMDIQMPVMNGLEATQRILAEFSVCIVILSVISEEEYVHQAEALGVCGYIAKPFFRNGLTVQLEDSLRNYQQSRAMCAWSSDKTKRIS